MLHVLRVVILILVMLTVYVQPVFAIRTILSATLNSASSVTVTPSALVTAEVNASLVGGGGGDDWGSTSYQVGSGSTICVNHANITSSGTFSQSFTITAPSSSGIYNVSFIIWRNDACDADPSLSATLIDGIIVATPTAVPTSGSATPTGITTPTSETSTPIPTPTVATNSSSPSSTTAHYPSVSLNPYFPKFTNTTSLDFYGLAAIENGTIALVEYSLDKGTTWIPAQAKDGNFNGKDEHFIFTAADLTERTYTVQTRAKSAEGLFTPEQSYGSDSVTVVTTQPTVALNRFTSNPTKSQALTITGTVANKRADIVTVEMSIDGGKSWRLSKRFGNIFSLALSALEDGNYPVVARAIDNAGNVGTSAPQTLIVDTMPPVIGGGMQSIGSHILTPDKHGAISLVSGTETTFAISMKGGVTEAVIKSDSATFPLSHKEGTNMWVGNVNFVTSGEKSLIIAAIDGAGNMKERNFNMISVASAGTVADKKSNQKIENAEVFIYFWETISKEWVLWDGQAYGQHNPQKTNMKGEYSFMLPAGTYYIQVRAADYKQQQSKIITVSQTTILNDPISLTPKSTIRFTLPIFGEIRLTLPSFAPPEIIALRQASMTAIISNDIPPKTAEDFPMLNLNRYRGKTLILSFIAPWSPLSLEQTPILSALSSSLSETQAMLVVMLQESSGTTEAFMKTGNYTFPVTSDRDGATAAAYNITTLPHHVFIGPDGHIQEVYTGVLTERELLEKL